ncbi:MAG: hypothetical protein ACREFC_09640 [Stellaceae bacterium]
MMLGLTPQEHTAIEAAVAAAEKRVSARIAVAVAHRADDYAAYPMLYAAGIALIVGDIVALAWSALGTWWIVAIQAALFIVCDLLLHLRPLRYRIVPARVKKHHAHKLARLEFAALIHDGAAGAGLLLFLAEAERHVEILPDAGVAARIAPDRWQKIVAGVTDGIAAGRAAESLSAAIEACAALLETHFPPLPGAAPPAGTVTEL